MDGVIGRKSGVNVRRKVPELFLSFCVNFLKSIDVKPPLIQYIVIQDGTVNPPQTLVLEGPNASVLIPAWKRQSCRF